MAGGFSIAGAEGQVIEIAAGVAIGGAVSGGLEPLLQSLRNRLFSLDPSVPVDPQTLGLLVRLGLLDRDAAVAEAAHSGIDGPNLDRYTDATLSPPSTGEILELLRRGHFTDEGARTAVEQTGIDPRYAVQYLQLAKILLSPADLAMMRQQSFISREQHLAGSALQGVDETDAELLFQISGEPPGAEFMVDMWRRGKATEEDVRQAIVEGRTKLKWTDVILKSKEVPLSVSLAVEAKVRERSLPNPPEHYAAAAGLSLEDFNAWVELAGRPIATGQALQLARRGQFSFDQFKEAVARSDVRTEYADDLWKLRRVIPPLFQVLRLLQANAVTDELAKKYVMEDGYDAELADAIVQAGHKGKTQRTHDLTAAQADLLYESGLQSAEWLHARLVAAGYTPEAADLHLEYLDAKLVYAAHEASIRRIHALYVTHKIDDSVMQADLDALGIRVQVKELLVHEWVQERAENVADLSDAEIGQALKYRVIDRADAIARWQRHGYSEADANLKADIVLRVARVAAGATP